MADSASTHVNFGKVRILEAMLVRIVEVIAAVSVSVEILLLLIGVVARYAFHHPLVWSDELASIVFLWLAMLGAVIAIHRNEHMRMTALVAKLSPAKRVFFDLFATAATLAFLLLIVWPAYEYVCEEALFTVPALGISKAWSSAALPVGIGLMAMLALLRLVRIARPMATAGAIASVVSIIALFYFAKPLFFEIGNLDLIVFFIGVVGASVFSGIPIAFAFGLAIFGYLTLATDTPSMVLVGRMEEGMSQLILLAVPLFVFLGLLVEMTGMAKALVRFLASLLGHVRGGLSYVLIAAMYLVSGISGSKAADMAAVAPVLFPEMRQRGTKQGELLALLAATGAQTETIPPSLVLITIGSVTSVSIRSLFTGGLLPGAVLGLMLCSVVWFRYRKEGLGHIQRATKGEIGRSLISAIPALVLPFVIRGAVVGGVATATEVSTIGIAYTTLTGFLFYRQFEWAKLLPMLINTACLSGAILLIIGTATGMAWGLTQSGFSDSLAAAMTSLPGGSPTFMVVSIVAFIVLGSVLEGIPAIVLFGPLLFPIARSMGIPEVQYAMVVILAMGIGLFSPPFGVGYYAACAVSRVAPPEGIRPMLKYLVVLIIGTAIVAIFPWISTGFL
jgi:tripartite ATP-independent transporter DctM subunit